MGSVEPAWKPKAAKKREAQLASIPKEWRLPEPLPKPKNTYEYLKTSGVLTKHELEITEHTDATILLRKMASGALSAVQVTTAFSKRAAIAQQLIRCCTEMFFDEALATAKYLDDYFEKHNKVIGPLHGLPVSLKDGFNITGQDTTLGWVCDIGKPATFDDILVKTLKAQGAVLYVKTNVPQSLMMSDSYNHVFKQSYNAFHNELISGGSSGGEGALVGARGSIVGIGTDIGGSIRIPANLQGLYGLCPTTRRIPWEKAGSRDYIVPSVCGPLTTSLSTLEYFTEAVLAGEPWLLDPVTVPLPWRRDLAAKPVKPLRIGYYHDDGAVRVQPPLEYAVRKVVSALSKAGHEVFEWNTSEHARGWDLWLKGVLADGGRRCRLQCEKENEPLIEGMLVGTKKDELNVVEGEEVHRQIREYQKKYLARWQEEHVDALIMPVQPYVGFKPKEWVKSSQYVGYSAQWNLLDFTALVMPVDVPDPDQIPDFENDSQGKWKDHKPRNESDRYNWEQYDPNLIRGMPVTVQIVTGKFGEEKAVAVAKAVEEALQLSRD